MQAAALATLSAAGAADPYVPACAAEFVRRVLRPRTEPTATTTKTERAVGALLFRPAPTRAASCSTSCARAARVCCDT
jgi:hypothetical protein